MTIADKIQFVNVIVISITLLVLLWQTIIQNRLSKAQLLRDRFEMYWRTYEPVSDQEVAEFHLKPTDYVTQDQYETQYKNDDKAIRKSIMMAKHYEYLAFLHTLKSMGIQDPLGTRWGELWTPFFATDKHFRDIHENYPGYYPKFEKFVDTLVASSREVQ